MFLDLKKIDSEGLAFEQQLRLTDLDGAAGEKIHVLQCELSGEVQKTKQGFDLAGHLETEVAVECSRCLEPFRVPIAQDFFLILAVESPGSEAERKREREEDEEAALFFCPDGRADLVQMVSEQIYLNLPLKPICRADCKGLCQGCGANRNVTNCDCRSGAVDPRLAPLLEFKNRRRM